MKAQIKYRNEFHLLSDEDIVNELDAIGRTTAMYATNGGTTDYLQCLKFLVGKGADLQHQSNGKL